MKFGTLWREWRHLIVLGSFILCYMVGFKYWATWQADQPIVNDYRRYLDYLAAHSPQAAAYEREYHRTKQRDSVASRHFEHVCAVMTALAAEEGFKLEDYPDFPSLWCHERSVHYSEFLLSP